MKKDEIIHSIFNKLDGRKYGDVLSEVERFIARIYECKAYDPDDLDWSDIEDKFCVHYQEYERLDDEVSEEDLFAFFDMVTFGCIRVRGVVYAKLFCNNDSNLGFRQVDDAEHLLRLIWSYENDKSVIRFVSWLKIW